MLSRRQFLSHSLSLTSVVGLSSGYAWAGSKNLLLPKTQQADEKKVALIIGNADYALRPLKNPIQDARQVSSALQALEFDVMLHENNSLAGMLDAMHAFWLKSRHAAVRVFYYAGHGLQYRGENFLLPVDARLSSEDDIPRQAASLRVLLDKLKDLSKGVNILILDTCRTPPFMLVRTRGLLRNGQSGLAQVVVPQGTLIAFSTSPGKPAYDGNSENSIYTQHLIAHLRTPGLPVEQMFKRVRIDVVNSTQEKQVPWESSNLLGEFCFTNGREGRCPA